MNGFRAARQAYRTAVGPAALAAAGRDFAREIIGMNARPAALAMTAADSAEIVAAAVRAPGDALAWMRAAVATLELNMIAEQLADPDCTELARQRLTACRRAGAALSGPIRAADVIREALADVEQAGERIDALHLRHRATRADNAGRPGEGRELREQALAHAPRDTYLEAVLLIELDRLMEARRVIDRLTTVGDEVRAELNFLAGRPEQARDLLLARLDTLAGPDPAWISLTRWAGIALALGDHAHAGSLAGQAIEVFEDLPTGAMHDYYRTLATDHVAVAEMYHVALRARLARGDVAGAFALADRCRAAMVRTGPRAGAARSIRAWRAASARLAATHERLAAAALTGVDQKHADVVAEIMAAEDAVDRAAAPLIGGNTPDEPVAGLAEIRRTLPENAALLLYQSFDRDLIVWAVRRDRVVTERRIWPRRDLIRAVRELHAACADFTADGSQARALAAALAKDLIEPMAAVLDGVDRLFVVPPAHLMLLPFAVLPLNGIPLGDRCVLSVLPSAALLTRPGADRQPGPDQPMLLVGDPAYADLPRLPGTGAEVRAIAAGRRSAVALTGADATASAFARHCAGRSIVHLATHGFVDELRPHLSGLALAGRDRITVPDLAGLDLDLDLLVLSACHTGRGRATAGGDVFGLARAAITAGVRHLVVSLWPVDDVSACLLMTTMYRRLGRGHDVAGALSCAARLVRGMDAGRRADAYARIAGAAATSGIREFDNAGTIAGSAAAGLPAHWAPFIHIGA